MKKIIHKLAKRPVSDTLKTAKDAFLDTISEESEEHEQQFEEEQKRKENHRFSEAFGQNYDNETNRETE